MAFPFRCACCTLVFMGIIVLCTLIFPPISWLWISQPFSELSGTTSYSSHRAPGDSIDIGYSKVWPYNNPSETYEFAYRVGICTPANPVYATMSLGQLLRGDRMMKTEYDVKFLENVQANTSTKKKLCSMDVYEAQLEEWRDMIHSGYIAEMYIDDLPVSIVLGTRGFAMINQNDTVENPIGSSIKVKSKTYTPLDLTKSSNGMYGNYGANTYSDDTWNSISNESDNYTVEGESFSFSESAEDETLEENSFEGENDGFNDHRHMRMTYCIASHLEFILGYNDGVIVAASVFPAHADDGTSPCTDITDSAEKVPKRIEFTYSVRWVHRPDIPTPLRLYRQLTSSFFKTTPYGNRDTMVPKTDESGEIHWLALINSFVLVLLILILLCVIFVRILRADLSRLMLLPDEELANVAMEDETGWKLLHADVFRSPPHRMAFSAMIGCGLQLLLVVVWVIFLGTVSPVLHRSTLFAAGLISYLLTTFIAGYISTSVYTKMGGENWAWNVIVTCFVFLLPTFLIWGFLGFLAALYGSSAALPIGTGIALLFCIIFVTLPLTIIGAVFGRRRVLNQIHLNQAFPCKTNKLAREIPRVRWYSSPWLHTILAGCLPFSGIYIEMHYFFMSVWSNNTIYAYSFLLLAFILLLLSTSAISILLTYVHLNMEDYRWQWRAFASGGSVSFYLFLFCIYYFNSNTLMTGSLQISYFFGYSIIFAWATALVLGCVSYFAASHFVKYIYSRIKCD